MLRTFLAPALPLVLAACAGPTRGAGESPPAGAAELAPSELAHVIVAWDGQAKAVELDGEPFTSFHARTDGAPFLHPLLAPGGLPVTRGFPMDPQVGESADHPHHRSLWFAHGDVSGHDFWHGKDTRIHLDTLGGAGDRIEATFTWLAGGEPLVREDRTMVFGGTATERWIDLTIRLAPAVPGSAPLVFGDTKEGTFALRLSPGLRVDGETAAGGLLDSEGRADGEVWGQRARWVAARGPVQGQPVTVAIFDAPTNPRHPTTWHARTYGLVAANPFGLSHFEGAAAGAGDLSVPLRLVLRYRVWLAAGAASPDRLEAAYGTYADGLQVGAGQP